MTLSLAVMENPQNFSWFCDVAFAESTLTSVTIQEGVENIKHDAFNGCTSLAAITIPNSVTQIGEWTFYNCTSLENIIIPSGVDSIGLCTFSGCTSLKSITIADSVTQIGDGEFQGCTGLESITIPNKVTKIGDWAFSSTGLQSITIPDSVTSIGNYALPNISGLKIYGNSGTAAETYATNNGFSYELIKDISTLTAELSSNSFVYDGIAKTPEVIVKDDTTTLVKDKDYTVAMVGLNSGKILRLTYKERNKGQVGK